MLNHRVSDKAQHYLDLLDAARCNSQWQNIPELTRKVAKHAPQRQCLVITAQTERAVAEKTTGRQPTSSTSNSLSESIPALVNAIEKEKTFKEDTFQAQICLAWLYKTLGEDLQALSTLPSRLDQASERFARDGGVTARWTHVCILKGSYIKGHSLEIEASVNDALHLYESMVPYISNVPSTSANTPEYQTWAETILSRYCMLSRRHISAHARNPHDLILPNAEIPPKSLLSPFRAYAQHWDARHARQADNIGSSLNAWGAYYDTLSILTQNRIVKPIFESKRHQVTELKKVEKTYETLLLQKIKFPRADQGSPEMESWIDQVMSNWRAISGLATREEDLGDGGRSVLGHGVLEILYRAATRTFHSTRVLRHLISIHASLAEFYLASKAIDSYFEILVKGKARVEKSGEVEVGLDDNSTALATAAYSIGMLCKHGRRREVEKSINIAKVVEGWLQIWHAKASPIASVSAVDVPEDLADRPKNLQFPVSRKALALGYHAIGVSQSRWARMTYETPSRSELQAKALTNFRAALASDLGEEDNVEILYSFAFVLAETRDIDTAIATIKRALSSGTRNAVANGVDTTDFASENSETDIETDADPETRPLLIRCWHLLALLLSARQDFSTAVISCEAALDLYGSKSILYGGTRRLDTSLLALSEKENILEIKMTQLALAEVTDGAEAAVNASGELLGLYTNLFKYVEKPTPTSEESSLSPSSSANGTLRSFRGSVLGLPKDPGLKSRKAELRGQNTASNSLRSHELANQNTQPPEIPATSLDGTSNRNESHHSHVLSRHESNKLQKKNSRRAIGSRRISRSSSPSRPTTSDHSHHPHLNLTLPNRNRHKESSALEGSDGTSHTNNGQYASDEVGVAISHDLPSMPSTPAATSDPTNPLHTIPSTTQNMNHRNPNTNPVLPKPPTSQNTQPPSISTSSLFPVPEPHYASTDQSRHALTLLTKIWLLISNLYRRASMPIDAQGALSEATTHAQSIESAVSNLDGSSAQNFSTPGYGNLKASDELWADVLAEQAALHVHMRNIEQASSAYEKALSHWPDHVPATVGLCTLLLDEYSSPPTTTSPPPSNNPPPRPPALASLPNPIAEPSPQTPDPDLFSRLAARDRAFGLLSALTKSGVGWDSSEAWYAYARACDESGMEEKAIEALWWVVELEEGRAVRGVGCIR